MFITQKRVRAHNKDYTFRHFLPIDLRLQHGLKAYPNKFVELTAKATCVLG